MAGFKKAVKTSAKLRMALAGPAGSGKTYTALALATALAGGQPVAVIDTEHGSASKYADLFAFDVLELDDFHPHKYVEAINEAAAAGYAVVVIDSLSHAWNGKGGVLEIVQRYGKTFDAWAKVKPIEQELTETIIGARIHVIATMRTKTEYVVEKDERGKNTPRKVGMAPQQREGMEYEFDVFGELDQENTLTIQKTRCPAITGAVITKPGKALAETLAGWLSGAGGDLAPAAAEPVHHVASVKPIHQEEPESETAAHEWTKAEIKTLFERWQKLQPEAAALRTAERFGGAMRQFCGHPAPFSNDERDRFAARIAEQERQRASLDDGEITFVVEENDDEPEALTPDPEQPHDLRTAPLRDIPA